VAAPDTGSGLFVGHGPVLWGFFRVAAVPQALRSPVADIGVPFGCGEDAGTVVVDDVEELEDIDEEELAR
jgi:hypothetical protein